MFTTLLIYAIYFGVRRMDVFFIKCVDTTIKKESKTYLLQFKSFIEYLSFSTISRVSEEFLEVIVVGLVSHEESHYPVQFAQ